MDISTKPTYRPLKEKSDIELLKLISSNDFSDAQTEFYYRYRGFLIQVCRKVCSNFINGEQLADDIFQNTIINAFKGIMNLNRKYSESETRSPLYIKAWLSVIAKNELIEFLRKNPDEKRLSSSSRLNFNDVDIPFESTEQDDEKPSIEKDRLEKGLANLSERERDILITYLLYQNYCQNKSSNHLPSDVISNLCSRHGVSKFNLRQIKKRALLKLKRECEVKG